MAELRQNPTAMLDAVETGETYRVTRHRREIARIIPRDTALELEPRKRSGSSRLSDLPRHELRTAHSIDVLLDEDRDR